MSDGQFIPLSETLNATLGIEIKEVEADRITGIMPVENRIKQPYGIVHGGALASIAETLASFGTYRVVSDTGKVAMGMSNQTQFLRSIAHGTVHAEAVVVHRGSTTWVWDVTITDDQSRICAVSRMTVAVRERRP